MSNQPPRFEPPHGVSQDVQLRDACLEMLAQWEDQTPEDERTAIKLDEMIFEAQVILMCEDIKRRKVSDQSIGQAVLEVGSNRSDEIADLVRIRLFDKDVYNERRRKVDNVFRQIIAAEMNRTVTRPAKVNRKRR